ncbi:DEAD/DEAH box helicase [Vibrio campbellii]|uniref:DEAD/DEAH box helicase n=1 Tax=Vibrio campbellii TaxID=680 RepID=UPI0037DC6CDA
MTDANLTTLTIPSFSFPDIQVSGNRVERFGRRSFELAVSIDPTDNADIVICKSPIGGDFAQFYIVKSKRVCVSQLEDYPVLYTLKPASFKALAVGTELRWLNHPLTTLNDLKPTQIAKSWQNQFMFKAEDTESGALGLRTPQIGALHAISAEFSRSANIEPSTVVLPTGTGKTETMLATTIYHRCDKVLVLVPSNSLRDQVGDKFKTLGCLAELGVVPEQILYPAVVKIKKGIKTVEEAQKLLDSANVLVATPQILKSRFSNSGVLETICNACSHLFVDEAHHISANTWNGIKEQFVGKRVVQFTATPFRNDTQSLGAKIIYNYTMGEAQNAGYFTNVQLEPVEEYFQDSMDLAIADKAIKLLQHDMDSGLDHLMMARVKTKERAKEVFNLYQKLAPELKPVLVHSDLSKTEQNKRLAYLRAREAKVVVCVDMLGEGYDLPNLKIAAIHDHHKSLAVTLQFIGRFTRVSHKETLGSASVVVNIADPGVEGALQKLYALGADWDEVLRRLSENQIEREVRLQEVVDSLRGQGDLHEQLSLWNLRPSCSAMLFKTDCESWNPEKFTDIKFSHDEMWHSISTEENILVLLAVASTSVKWGHFKDVKDINYKILIAHWDNERNALLIYSNDYKGFKVEILAEKLCGESTYVMSGKQIFNVLNNIEYPLVNNLGSAQNGAISFTQFFGPNVTEGLSAVEKSASTLSNIAAMGYEDGNKVLWGCSERKGKVWSPKAGSIADWLLWAKAAWDKVVEGGNDDTNITRDFLRPQKIDNPHPYMPISIQWGEQLQVRNEEGVKIYFGPSSFYLYEVDLKVTRDEQTKEPILVFESFQTTSKYKLLIDQELTKGYDYQLLEGEPISIQVGNSEPRTLIEQMYHDPIFVYYADGSFSYNCYWVEVKDNIGSYSPDSLHSVEWTVDITKESMGANLTTDTVQHQTWQLIDSEYDIVINDDDHGEAADLVAIKSLPDKIILSLYHCKYSHGSEPGRRLSDLYEVCGQAQRSVRWKHVGLPYLYKHIQKREGAWKGRGQSRFLKGNMAQLESIKNRSRTTPIEFQVAVVQPGVSKEQITEEMLKLLGTTELFIKKTTLADLRVWCSE